MKEKIKELFKLNQDKTFYWFEWVIILIAHLALLKWILYALGEGAILPTEEMILHFTGIAIFGALLIRICAYLAKRKYLQKHKHLNKNFEHVEK